MFLKLIIFVLFLPLLLIAQEEAVIFANIDEALSNLSHPDYHVRASASKYLWETANLEQLQAHAGSKDPEVRFRIKEITMDMISEIGPDTPEEVKTLVKEFHGAEPQRKAEIINLLIKLEAYPQIFSIFHHLDDSDFKEDLTPKISYLVKPAVSHFMQNGEIEKALEVLDLANSNTENARLWAAISLLGDSEQDVIKAFGELQTPSDLDKKRHLAVLRTSGNLDKAKELALEMEDEAFIAGLAIREGDLQEYFTWWKRENTDPKINQDFLNAFEARFLGNWESMNQYEVALTAASKTGKKHKTRAIMHFIALGKNSSAFSLANEEEKLRLTKYLSGSARYEEFFNLFDYPFGEQPSEEWINKNISNSDGEWWFDSALEGLGVLGETLRELGGSSALDAMLDPLWKEAKKDAAIRFNFLTQLHSQGYTKQALRYASEILEGNEIKLKRIFISSNDIHQYLWQISTELFPHFSFSDHITLILSSTGGNIEGEELLENVEALISTVEKDCEENPNDSRRESHLASLYTYIGYKDKVLKFLEGQYQENQSTQNANQLMNQYVFLGREKEAAELALKQNEINSDKQDLMKLHLAGIMEKGGLLEESNENIEKYNEKALDDPRALNLALSVFKSNSLPKYVKQYLDKGLNVTNPEENHGTMYNAFLEHGKEYYANEGEHYMAAIFGEACILETLKKNYESGNRIIDMLMLFRYKTDLSWAQYYAKEGNKPKLAAKIIGNLAQQWKGNGIIADDLYPIMRKLGYNSLLKKSLEDNLNLFQETIALYPKAYGLKNTVAWLASRAVMELPTANKYIKEALISAPRRAAYLDTAAEVYFAMGDRKKALNYSKRAWQDSQLSQLYEDAEMIKAQYYHFKDDPLPQAQK